MTHRLSAALLALVLSASARAADAPGDAAVLVKQGQRLDKEGKPEMALELYKAALLMAPRDAAAHLGLAGTLSRLKRCGEAVPEYRTYLEVAPAKAKAGSEYASAVVGLAMCLRETQSHLEVRPSIDARCSVDGGTVKEAGPTSPAGFDVIPGTHEVSCVKDGRYPATESVVVTATEKRAVELTLAPIATGHELASPPPPAKPDATPPPDATPAATAGPEFVMPPIDAEDGTTPSPTPVAPAPTPAPAPPEATSAAPAVATSPAAPAEAAPAAAAPPAAPASTTGEIKIEAEGRGWTCQVDGGPFLAPDIAGEIYADVAPGEHVIGCDRDGSAHVEAHVGLGGGDKRIVRVKPYPKAGSPSGAPPVSGPTGPAAPMAAVHRDDLEWQLAGGFGPGLGTFGLGLGLRSGPLGVMLGSGLYPFLLSGTYSFKPGETGFYLGGGYVRVGEGLLGGGSTVKGHGLWAGGGIDVRPDPNLSFRIGAGLGYNSTGLSTGPLVFDFNVAYVP